MKSIALAGNQNCGKTTLYNLLTGSNRRVGNFPGVTVEKRSGRLLPHYGKETEITDLPGLYSLYPYSDEERAAAAFLLSEDGYPDALIIVADATCPARSLYLALQLAETGLPATLALNMYDLLEKKGGSCDTEKLGKMLGIPTFAVSAADGRGIEALMDAALKPEKSTEKPRTPDISESAIIQRYKRVDLLCRECFRLPQNTRESLSEKADRLLCGRFSALPCFCLFILLMFALTFSLGGGLLSGMLARTFEALSRTVGDITASAGVAPVVTDLLTDGIIAGVGGVLTFLPTVAILFFLLSIAEDSGYMARIAFIFDRPMRLFGLSGRDAVPLLMGFGCSVPAILAARTSTSDSGRRRTVYLVPFFACSAKLPVFAFFSSLFFGKHRIAVITALYLTGIAVGLLSVLPFRGKEGSSYMLELPEYRLPRVKNVLRNLSDRCTDFVKRAFTVIFLASVVCWALGYFDLSFHHAKEGESILALLGGIVAPILEPLGFGDARLAASLVAGLFAKEAVLSSLAVTPGVSSIASLFPAGRSVCAFLVFFLLYPPCLAAFAATRKELSSFARACLHTLARLLLAYAAAAVINNIPL